MLGDRTVIRQTAHDITTRIFETMYGMDHTVRLCLVALFTKGHVLLEANPGMGKTSLVKASADAMGLSWGRIQFTPDLMPADITGTEIPMEDGFQFQEGPIFKTLLLADEINRASPKTQSAMLEAMAERQATVLGQTYSLPRFFTVFATQNPIDHEGVYPLPEAQSDRFMFKICLYPPDLRTLSRIVEKDSGPEVTRPSSSGASREQDQTMQDELDVFYQQIRSTTAHGVVELHIQNMFLASNLKAPCFRNIRLKDADLRREQRDWVRENASLFQFGLSPRAAIALNLATKAWFLMFAEHSHDKATAADFAQVVLPVLRHRLKPTWDWEENYQKDSNFAAVADLDNQQKVDWLLTRFVCNTAPNQDRYAQLIEQHLASIYA